MTSRTVPSRGARELHVCDWPFGGVGRRLLLEALLIDAQTDEGWMTGELEARTLVKNGGLISCLDTKTGQPAKEIERVYGSSNFYASPVAGDGKIYTISERGDCSVILAGADWKQISRSKFNESVYATPAIADGRIYLRTAGHLYCFGVRGRK